MRILQAWRVIYTFCPLGWYEEGLAFILSVLTHSNQGIEMGMGQLAYGSDVPTWSWTKLKYKSEALCKKAK